MKIVTIVGARPQFIKSAIVSRAINKYNERLKYNNQKYINEIIIHTGQHFDYNMSDVFFKQMQISKPNYNLDINCLNNGAMTGQMLWEIEEVLLKARPYFVLLYGDTNSTLAGALAAKKLHINIAHVEAGLRSFNMQMPEEVNRILTDRISNILFCPTDKAIENLRKEGFENFDCKIVKCGDVMLDAAIFYSNLAKKPEFNIPNRFILSTIHRAENTDNTEKLTSIIAALNEISKEIEIILPLHPRTRKKLELSKIKPDFKTTNPVGYLEMIYLLNNCSMVITDSGGLQKESFFFKKPCITVRDETEWVELIEHGFNRVVGSDKERIYKNYKEMLDKPLDFELNLYGDGNASTKIVRELTFYFQKDTSISRCFFP